MPTIAKVHYSEGLNTNPNPGNPNHKALATAGVHHPWLPSHFYQLPVNSSHDQLVTRSSRHNVLVNSSHVQLGIQSTRGRRAVPLQTRRSNRNQTTDRQTTDGTAIA